MAPSKRACRRDTSCRLGDVCSTTRLPLGVRWRSGLPFEGCRSIGTIEIHLQEEVLGRLPRMGSCLAVQSASSRALKAAEYNGSGCAQTVCRASCNAWRGLYIFLGASAASCWQATARARAFPNVFFHGADDAFGVNPRFFFRGVDVPVEGLARPLGNQVFNISRRYDNQMKAFALRVLVDVHIIVSCMR